MLALSRRWELPEQAYRRWSLERQHEGEAFALGGLQCVEAEPDLWVANMIAQSGVRPAKGVPPIRYGALETCLHKLQQHAVKRQASVHMPRIGCGLAGGSWDKVEPLIQKLLGDLDVTVYDFRPT